MDDATSAVQRHLPLDMLVNNVDIIHLKSALDTTMLRVEQTLTVNTLAPLRLGQLVAADLIWRGRGGAIVNLPSIATRIGFARHAAYCASKAALDTLTRVLAVELGRKGIRANGVSPVMPLTPMARLAGSDAAKIGSMLARIPLCPFCTRGEFVTIEAPRRWGSSE